MKKLFTLMAFLSVLGMMSAQTAGGMRVNKAQRKFKILVKNEEKADVIMHSNNRIAEMQESARQSAQRGLLGELLWAGYTSAFKQKTVNATSNLVSLGLDYLTKSFKSDREKWYDTALKQCYYNQRLSAESKIDDFYALPSTKGAMDPANLRFEGFGCSNFIEVIDQPGQGKDVFYIFCKMRRDDEGLRHIVNHSKFLVELDTLMVNPRYCNLPNDSTGSVDSRFSFEKRDSLDLELKVRLYSSWMNQGTMIFDDQLLGEFTISVLIDKNCLTSDSLFIYDKNNPEHQKRISIEGDSYIVPRSFTGTTDAVNYQPAWGTGQYRVEMEVSERCTIVDQIRESGSGEAVALADATPGKKKWDKAKWKTEWNAMKVRKRGASFLKNAWNCVISAYRGSSWTATLTDPFTTALYSYETTKLEEGITSLHDKLFPAEEKTNNKGK